MHIILTSLIKASQHLYTIHTHITTVHAHNGQIQILGSGFVGRPGRWKFPVGSSVRWSANYTDTLFLRLSVNFYSAGRCEGGSSKPKEPPLDLPLHRKKKTNWFDSSVVHNIIYLPSVNKIQFRHILVHKTAVYKNWNAYAEALVHHHMYYSKAYILQVVTMHYRI